MTKHAKKMEHTPGPWRIEATQMDHGETTTITGDDGLDVARIPSPAWNRHAKLHGEAKRDRANACLIKAAPALLAAARECLARWERGDLAEAMRALQGAVDSCCPETAAARKDGAS